MRLLLASLALLVVAPDGRGQDGLVAYTVTDGMRIDAPLTGRPGDWRRGRDIYFDRALTGCSSCHGSPGGPGAEVRAENNDAPGLSGIASRMSEGEIRLWIVAPATLDPRTDMPGFYLAGQRTGAENPIINGPWLSAAEIEDLVAYLARQIASR